MSAAVTGMIALGLFALIAGLLLSQRPLRAAPALTRVLLLGPIFEAAALAIFAGEHFFMGSALSMIVPHWLPGPLFWTYFVGAALLAAAVSFITWLCVRWSAPLLALLFLLIVITIDLHVLPKHLHDRLFWTLTLRELCFSAGAMVLAGSVWPGESFFARMLRFKGRILVAAVMVFYAAEHFLFPNFVPGVPLEKPMPPAMPAATIMAYAVGGVLLIAGIALFIPRKAKLAAAVAGAMLLLLTAFFYLPIMLMELHSPLAVEGINYVGDTLLFASTVLLAGFDRNIAQQRSQH